MAGRTKFDWSRTLANLSEQTQKQMEKYVCRQCNKMNRSQWNVCRDCDIFLCDYCMERNHASDLHHTITRYNGFSEFGCIDHIQICKYFCSDCKHPRCESCKETKCRQHDLKLDAGKREDNCSESVEMRTSREKRTSFTRSVNDMEFKWPNASWNGPTHRCKYCFLTQKLYNLCEDCLDFFCDSCLVMYHPPGHTICKRIPFSEFACGEHKRFYKYFCNQCRKLRCEDCITMKSQCFGHADQLTKKLDHIAHEQTKFMETVDKASRTIDTLISDLDQIEDEFSMRAIISRDILRHEMTSIQDLITEKEIQLSQEFEQEYQYCLNRIRECKISYGNLMEENGQLLSKSLQILRKNNHYGFYFGVRKILNRIDKHKIALDSLCSPSDVLDSPILFPFTLSAEKKELESSLQIKNFGCPTLVCHNHVVYYKDFSKPLRVDELLAIYTSTSTAFSLNVEIRSSVKDTLWKSDDCSCQQYIANVPSRVRLQPKKRYLMQFSLQTKQDRLVVRTVSRCNVLLVTGIAFAQKETQSSLSSMFKPAAGTWTCDTCRIQNKRECSKCVACQTPKPGTGASPLKSNSSGTPDLKFGNNKHASNAKAGSGFKID